LWEVGGRGCGECRSGLSTTDQIVDKKEDRSTRSLRRTEDGRYTNVHKFRWTELSKKGRRGGEATKNSGGVGTLARKKSESTQWAPAAQRRAEGAEKGSLCVSICT